MTITQQSHTFYFSRKLLQSLFWVLIFNTALLYGQPQQGTLELTIVDVSTGEAVPARVEILGSDKEYHVAEDALFVGGDCDMSDEGAGLVDLKTTLATFSQKIENAYTKTTQFYSTGNSKILLPTGSATIRVFKGPEYKMGSLKVEIEAEKTIQPKIELSRWINMPENGWYSSDDHLHIPRPVKELDPIISKMMQAEGINVANLLLMGKVLNFTIAPQHSHGKESHYQEKNYILAAGQENPRSHFLGHSITLGAKTPINFADEYLIYRLVWQEAIKQKGINGYAHYGHIFGNGEYGLPVVLHHNLMHFIEVLQFGRNGYDAWYDILNLGFRVSPTAGTDYPCAATTPGHERFYTKVEGDFTYKNWLDGIRKGRTFVTTGPLLEFTINGKDIGEEIELENPDSVFIEIKVLFDNEQDSIEKLELIENGDVVRSFPYTKNTGEINIKIKHAIKESSWLSLRGNGRKFNESMNTKPWNFGALNFSANSLVHSAPIYVTIANAPPFTEHSRTKAVARTWLAQLEEIEILLSEDNMESLAEKLLRPYYDAVPKETLFKNRSALLAEIQDAKDFFIGLSR